MRRLAPALLLAGLATGRLHAAEGRFHVVAYGQVAMHEGDARIAAARQPGDRFDVNDEFGVDPHEPAPGIEGFVTIRRARLMYRYDVDPGPVTMGPLIGVQAFETRYGIRKAQGGCCHIDQEETVSRLVPSVGAAPALHPHPRLALHALFTASSFRYHDLGTALWQGSFGIDWNLL